MTGFTVFTGLINEFNLLITFIYGKDAHKVKSRGFFPNSYWILLENFKM